MDKNRKAATFRLGLASALTASFGAWLWIMTSRFLSIAWEPGVPGREVYHSWNGYAYALWMLFVPLCWITVPVILLLAYYWATTVIRFRKGESMARAAEEDIAEDAGVLSPSRCVFGSGVKKKVAFTLVAWLSIFAIFEIGLRSHIAVTKNVEARDTFDPASIFVPHPFFAYAANPAHPGHNAQGYRAEESRVYEADPNSVNIVCLGGSSTYGTRVHKEHSYPYRLEERLSEIVDRPVNVLNGGLGGYSTPNIVALLSLKIVHLEPDLIIFYVGFNDAWNRLLFSDFKTDYSHAQKSWLMPGTPFWRRSLLLDSVASQLGYPSGRDPHVHQVAWRRRSGRPEANWRNSSIDAFGRNLRTLVAISRAHDATPVLVTQATDFRNHPLQGYNSEWMRAMDEHTEIIEQVARDMSVDLIDIRKRMSDTGEYFVDVIHMNEKGNRKRAEIIAEYLAANELVGR